MMSVVVGTFTITEHAAVAIQHQRLTRGTPNAVLRLGIRTGNCSGFAYFLEWDDSGPRTTDKVFQEYGVMVCIDAKSFAYLRGTELDFVKSAEGSGFKFNNPNVKDQCSCGESVQF